MVNATVNPDVSLRRASAQGIRPALVALPLVFLPLFVGLPNLSVPIVHLLGVSTSRDALNLSCSVVICLFGAWLWTFVGYGATLNRHVTLCFGWLTVSVVVGMFFEPAIANVLFYVQTILPLFAIGYGALLVRRSEDIPRLISVASAATAFAVVMLTVLAIFNFGIARLTLDRISVMKEIAYAIPQFKSYYPMTVLATFSFALSRYLFSTRGGRNATLLLAAHALFLPLCWSRAGMLGFALCAAIQLGYAMLVGAAFSKQRAVTVSLLFLLVVPLAASKLGSTFGARTDVHDLDNRSDRKRLELFLEGCDRIVASPLLGDMFIPTWEERAGGEEIGVKRLFGAHNQFVDWGLRGGLPYLIIAVSFTLVGIARCRTLASPEMRRLRSDYAVVGVGGAAFLISVLVGSNFQLYYIQLQTATPIYAILGVVYRTYDLASAEATARRRQRRIASPSATPHPGLRKPAHRLAQTQINLKA